MIQHFSTRVAAEIVAFLTLIVPACFSQGTVTKECFKLEEPAEHYFGEIAQRDTVEHTFVFRNHCADSVEIESAASSCGCTSVLLTDRVVPPRGEARVMVKFTPPRSSRDRVSKSVRIYLKGETEPHSILQVTATLKRAIEIDPFHIRLSTATVGVRSTVRSTVRNVSDRELFIEVGGVSLTSYPADPEKAGGSVLPLDGGTVTPTSLRLQPGESRELTIGFTPEHAGQINGSVGLQVGDNNSIIFLFAEVGGT